MGDTAPGLWSMAPGMKSYLYGMDRHNADDTAWYLMTVFFHSKEPRFRKIAGQALHEICVKKGTAYEPYVLEVQPSKLMFLEQAELQWRNSLICPGRVEITTTWRCRRKMSPLCHAKLNRIGMTAWPGFCFHFQGAIQLFLSLFRREIHSMWSSRHAGMADSRYKATRAWKLLISGIAYAIIDPWCRYRHCTCLICQQ